MSCQGSIIHLLNLEHSHDNLIPKHNIHYGVCDTSSTQWHHLVAICQPYKIAFSPKQICFVKLLLLKWSCTTRITLETVSNDLNNSKILTEKSRTQAVSAKSPWGPPQTLVAHWEHFHLWLTRTNVGRALDSSCLAGQCRSQCPL